MKFNLIKEVDFEYGWMGVTNIELNEGNPRKDRWRWYNPVKDLWCDDISDKINDKVLYAKRIPILDSHFVADPGGKIKVGDQLVYDFEYREGRYVPLFRRIKKDGNLDGTIIKSDSPLVLRKGIKKTIYYLGAWMNGMTSGVEVLVNYRGPDGSFVSNKDIAFDSGIGFFKVDEWVFSGYFDRKVDADSIKKEEDEPVGHDSSIYLDYDSEKGSVIRVRLFVLFKKEVVQSLPDEDCDSSVDWDDKPNEE